MTVGVILGEVSFAQNGLGPGEHGVLLERVEKRSQLRSWALIDEGLDVGQHFVGDRVADEIPNHCAKLELGMK